MITIVDYGMGNLGSIVNMLKYLGVSSRVESSPDAIFSAQKIILPGVGSFDQAMKNINNSGMYEALNYLAKEKKIPFLGICLGMQLLTEGSEEGTLPGLGLIPAETKKLNHSFNLKIPHMGWNYLSQIVKSPLTKGLSSESKFYFVHSYFVKVKEPKFSLLTTVYGEEFCSAIFNDHICGVQFHPEKSHRHGMLLLKNFSEM